jgi:hypothetical protein
MTTAEYFDTSLKKGRGRAKKSLDLIEAMTAIAEAAQPITGRGVGYKLFTAGLIPSMGRSDMQRVYRLLKEAREEGIIPWHWIVDETRDLERKSSWDDRTSLREPRANNTGATSGPNNLSGARCGQRRARCEACSRLYLISTVSGSGSCTVSRRQPSSMTSPMTVRTAR